MTETAAFGGQYTTPGECGGVEVGGAFRVRLGHHPPRPAIQAVARAREGFPTASLGLGLVSPAQPAGPGQLAMSLQSL